MPTLDVTDRTLQDLLATLVDIPSVTGEEDAIATWVAERIAAVGRGALERDGNAVVWRSRVPGRDAPRPRLVLAGHLDTVPPNGNARARVEGGRLYGLGATDMKGGDAVMLALIETVDLERSPWDVTMVFYDAEEGPSQGNGLKRLLAAKPWLAEARLAILLEPTDLKVELGCNGVINAEVVVRGKSGHSARPWSGINAIERAAPWLAEITRFPSRPVTLAGATFTETLQMTTLRAGRTRNVIPDELVANLNYRFTPDLTLAAAEARLRERVPAEFACTVVDAAAPGKVCADHPEVRAFIERFGADVAAKQGWTDVARFTDAGIPAFNFGPGLPELCHQAEEYCPVENLVVAYRRLREFLEAPPPRPT